MSDFLLLPAKARTARPWRNGGGLTREIAVFPFGADGENFLWRASIATIAEAGPFSAWPGIDRMLLVLEGQLAVSVDGGDEALLDTRSPPFGFAGEKAIAARPVGSVCLALNFMARRGLTRMQLVRCRPEYPPTAQQTLLLATKSTTVRLNERVVHLTEHDALLLGPTGSGQLQVDPTVIVAQFVHQTAGSA